MSRTWVALLELPSGDAERSVPVDVQGHGAWVLESWTAKHHPHPRSRAIDPRALGADGPPMSASWIELDVDRRPLFDDPAVLEARRRLLRNWPAFGASSMVTDGVRLAGSVLLHRREARPPDDPFARIGSPRVLQTQGFFVPVPRPTGPALERYGGSPWPYDRFPCP